MLEGSVKTGFAGVTEGFGFCWSALSLSLFVRHSARMPYLFYVAMVGVCVSIP